MKDVQDAYGHELYDYLQGRNEYEIVERSDGFIDASTGPRIYCAGYEEWPAHYKEALRYVRGSVLDIGCGAGRHCLYLQEQGFDVLGIDVSPLAIEVCARRGVRHARVMSVMQVTSRLGQFDTLLMLGNNFGLFGDATRARRLLRTFHSMTSGQARIIAESTDPYGTTDAFHLGYHDDNRKRGRMAGQLRIRVRYRKYATTWFDYLLVSQDEMRAILDGTDWTVARFVDSDAAPYIAILEKVSAG